MRIQTDVLSNLILNRQTDVMSNIRTALEQVSSGYRINHAADDAAGLAISEKLRSRIAGFTQANRNVQDGISLLQTAEGGLDEAQTILQRMRTLAVQAANDVNTDADRVLIQKEVTQLLAEIDRLPSSVEFNTKKLLSGAYAITQAGTTTVTTTVNRNNSVAMAEDLTNISNDAGVGIEDNGSYSPDGQWIAYSSNVNSGIYIRRSDGSGVPIQVISFFGGAEKVEFSPVDNRIVFERAFNDKIYVIDATNAMIGGPQALPTQLTFGGAMDRDPTWSTDGTEIAFASDRAGGSQIFKVPSGGGAVVQFTFGASPYGTPTYTPNGTRLAYAKGTGVGIGAEIYTVDAITGLGELQLTNTSTAAIANDSPTFSPDGKRLLFVKSDLASGLEVYSKNADGSGNEIRITNYGTPGSGPMYPEVSPDNSHFSFWDTGVGTVDIFTAATRYRIDTTGMGIVPASMSVRNTTTGSAIANDAVNGWTLEGSTLYFNGGSVPGANDIIEISWQEQQQQQVVTPGSDGLTLHVGPEENQTLQLSLPAVSSAALGLSGLTVATQTDAETAIGTLDTAINTLSSARANIGAQENRLEHTFSFNSIAGQNEQAAESRIRDADVATAMMNLAKNQLLSQAGMWALQSARMNNESILRLLQ